MNACMHAETNEGTSERTNIQMDECRYTRPVCMMAGK